MDNLDQKEKKSIIIKIVVSIVILIAIMVIGILM